MLDGALRLGDQLTWQPTLWRARERVRVTGIAVNRDQVTLVELRGPDGRLRWHEEGEVRECCERVEAAA